MRLVATSAAVAILFAFDFFSGGALRAPARSLAASVSLAAGNAGVAITRRGIFATKASLARENDTLRTQLTEAHAAVSEAAALRDENAHLRALAHLAERAPGIAAPIVSVFGASAYGTFLIGAGTDQGIAAGDIVFSEDGFAIGRVSEAGAKTALVTELFVAGSSLPIVVAQSQITAEGQGGGNARARAPRGLDVKEGDIATAPSHAGAPVGIVLKIESDSASAYTTLYLRTPANLSALRFVFLRRAL